MPGHKLRWSYLDVLKQKHLVIAQAANVATKVPEDKLLEAEQRGSGQSQSGAAGMLWKHSSLVQT